jgi:hypothetical protein
MSTRDALIQELMRQPEPVLQKMRQHLDALVRLEGQNGNSNRGTKSGWPQEYFKHTAGAFAGEVFERPAQLPFEKREDW